LRPESLRNLFDCHLSIYQANLIYVSIFYDNEKFVTFEMSKDKTVDKNSSEELKVEQLFITFCNF